MPPATEAQRDTGKDRSGAAESQGTGFRLGWNVRLERGERAAAADGLAGAGALSEDRSEDRVAIQENLGGVIGPDIQVEISVSDSGCESKVIRRLAMVGELV